MANLRQLSVFVLSLSLLVGSGFSSNSQANPNELKNPPPSKKIFYEGDLWLHPANKEWVFTHILLSAIRTPNDAKIDKMQVSSDTKESLHTIRKEFLNPDTQSRVETASMSDLVYAYSWSNAGYSSYMFSGLQAIKNRVMDVDNYVANSVSFYKDHKLMTLGSVGIAAGVPTAIYATKALITPPAANPPQGWFLIRHIKNAGLNIADKAQGLWTAIGNHPYIAAAMAGTFVAYETCVTAGNKYLDVPTALMYYTDRIAGGDGTAQSGTYTNTFYGFSHHSAGDHFRWYIDMNTYVTILRGFLNFGKRMNQLQFGAIPPHAERLLYDVSRNIYLSEMLYTPNLPDYFDRLGIDFSKGREQHRKQVADVVSKAVNISNPVDDCKKYFLFNDALLSDNPDPLYLFSLCSVGDTFAYAKLPWLPYARMKKTEVTGFIQELMEYTGSTRLVVMYENPEKKE